MITFADSNVKRGQNKLPSTTLEKSMADRTKRAFEAVACNVPNLIQSETVHGFLAAVHLAFDLHCPLVLSPDDVWLCLAQGFATHVDLHAESLRHKFVRHDGKLLLTVIRDAFVKGSPANDWPGVFSELSQGIAEHIGKKRDLIVANFSTTGAIECAASEIVLFEAMQNYFDYKLITKCGIPEITLLGTVDDWLSIRRRAAMFAEFELPGWTASLLPVLDKIVQTARGHVDLAFWRSLYKENGGSGGPYVTGWLNVLFPYVEGYEQPDANMHAMQWAEGMNRPFEGGPAMHEFPSGLSSAPFIWDYLGTPIPMVFMGGFAGVSQDASTGAVRPAIGWAIGEK